jgi:hypothetical protein
MTDNFKTKLGEDRVSVPLLMLDGNLDALLENEIPVQSIALARHGGNGVILRIKQTEEQKEEAKKLGFRTVPFGG